MADFEELTEKVKKLESLTKVLQLIIKDLPRKNKEEDPHFKPYSEFYIELEEKRIEN